MENNGLDRNEIRASIFEIVNRMSDEEMLAFGFTFPPVL